MQKLFKSISKSTGNLCFGGSREEGDYLFYVSRNNKTINYVSCRLIEGITFHKFYAGNDYFIATHGDSWLSLFDGNTINSSYIYTAPYKIYEIVKGQGNSFFAIDKNNSKLIKFDINFSFPSFSLLWELPLNNFNFDKTGIIYRGANQTIVLNDSDKIYVVQDVNTYGRIVDTITVPGTNQTVTVCSGEFNTEIANFRYRQVYGDNLIQSSSSSTSSSLSMSSESSTSSSSSSLITSSSSSLITSSSSSSVNYSTSSSFMYSISSDSTSSSSLGDSSSSSYGLSAFVNELFMGWENRGNLANYSYDDVIHQIKAYALNGITALTNMPILVSFKNFDINGDPIYRLFTRTPCILKIVTNKGFSTFSSRMYIYKNNTIQDNFLISTFGGVLLPRTTNVTMGTSDELKIRMVNTDFDLFHYETYYNDNRIRAKIELE